MAKLTPERLKRNIEKLVRSKIYINAYVKATDVIFILEDVLLPLIEEHHKECEAWCFCAKPMAIRIDQHCDICKCSANCHILDEDKGKNCTNPNCSK